MKRISVLLLIMISLLATLFAGTGRIPGVSALTVTDVTLSTRQAGAVSSYTIAGTINVELQSSIHTVVVTFPIGQPFRRLSCLQIGSLLMTSTHLLSATQARRLSRRP